MDTTTPRWRRIARYPLVVLVGAVILYMLALWPVGAAMKLASIPEGTTLFSVTSRLVAMAMLLLVYKGIIARLGAAPRDEMRLAGSLRPTLAGLGVGLGLMSAIVAVAAAIGVYRIAGPGDTRDLGMALLAAGLFPALTEELLFRGILFRWLEEWGGSLAALALTSALFGAAHIANPNATVLSAVGIALEAGILLGGAYMLTRSLWLPMGIHAGWNLAQGGIWDVPVSGNEVHGLVEARLTGDPLLTGGAFGLEASLIAMVLATAFGLWLVRRAARAGEWMAPIWVRRRRAAAAALGSAAVTATA